MNVAQALGSTIGEEEEEEDKSSNRQF